MSKMGQALSVLIVSTLAFTVCFMVWMMFGVIGIPIRKTLNLNATEFGLLTATPVLTGSLIRVPLGMWTDKFGGRIVLFVLMLLCVVPIWLIGYATAVLAVPGARPLRRARRRLVLGRHAVRRALVSEEAAGLRDGRLRRGQFRRGGQQVRRAGAGRGVRLDDGAAGVRGDHARHCAAVLVLQLLRPGPSRRFEDHLARAARRAEGPEGLEALPVLLDRVRRLRRDEPVDGAVLRRRIRPRYPRRRAAGGVLLASGRRAARGRRLDLRQVRRPQRHLVGAVGQLDLPVPALLSADRHDDHDRRRAEDVPRRPQRVDVHRR